MQRQSSTLRMPESGRMRGLRTALLLIATLGLSGCPAIAPIIQATAEVGMLIVTVKKKPILIQTAECGEIEPIYPSDGFLERLTEDELNQIDAQAVRLEELCGK